MNYFCLMHYYNPRELNLHKGQSTNHVPKERSWWVLWAELCSPIIHMLKP